MTEAPTPGAAAELPVVGWIDNTTSAFSFYRFDPAIALTPHAPAQSQLDALREEVARLTKERDEWKEAAEHNLSRRLSALGERNAARAGFKNFHRSLCARFGYPHDEVDWFRDQVSLEEHIAALKAQPTDVDALMALADEYARALVRDEMATVRCEGMTAEEEAERVMHAAREALRAKLAARKEPT